jgi:hypothetical protein
MNPYRPYRQSAVPRTLHTQLEIANAIRTLAGPDEDERLRARRAEIAAIRHDLEVKRDFKKAGEECLAAVQAELRRLALAKKYNPDQPRVPVGNRDGGQWTNGSKVGSDTPIPRTRYAALDTNTRPDATERGSSNNLFSTRNNLVLPDMPYASEFPGGRADLVFGDYQVIRSYEIPDDHPKHPVPFVDSSGRQILDDQGNPILRPDNPGPEAYVEAGLAARSLSADIHQFNQLAATGLVEPSALAGLAAKIALELAPFTHGGSLDAERFESYYVRDYRHYTSIATGIFMAAAGVSREDALAFADFYASLKSKFSSKETTDEDYPHSTRQDIEDNLKGYDLYESGRIRLGR